MSEVTFGMLTVLEIIRGSGEKWSGEDVLQAICDKHGLSLDKDSWDSKLAAIRVALSDLVSAGKLAKRDPQGPGVRRTLYYEKVSGSSITMYSPYWFLYVWNNPNNPAWTGRDQQEAA